MSPRALAATAQRVLAQLRRDRRTLAMLIVVPVVLLALVKWIFYDDEATFQRIGIPLLGIFPLVSMFLVTSITMLRERTGGTLERLMTLPIGRLDLIGGYAVAFSLAALVQAVVASAVALGLLDLDPASGEAVIIALAVLDALLGMALGLFVSAFARTEFQAVQFLPAVLLPQVLLCGLLTPVDQMAEPLQVIARLLPMTYAYDALTAASTGGAVLADAAVVAAFAVAALVAGAITLRREV